MSPKDEESQDTRVAITRAEMVMLIMIVALGVGAWAWIDLQVNSYTKDWEPREERVQLAHDLHRLGADLEMAREERKQTEAQLIKARLELHRQNAALAAAAPQATPGSTPSPSPLTTPAPAKAGGGHDAESPPPAVTAATKATATRHAALLTAHHENLRMDVERLTWQVEEAKRKAANDFGRGQFWYRIERPGLTLFWATLATVVLTALLLLVWRLLRRADAAEVLRPQAPVLAWLLCGLLCVLFAYQAFSVVGAAFAGALVLTVYLARAPWEARRADKAGGTQP